MDQAGRSTAPWRITAQFVLGVVTLGIIVLMSLPAVILPKPGSWVRRFTPAATEPASGYPARPGDWRGERRNPRRP